MNKTALILRYEIGTVARRKGFIFSAIGIPLIAALVFLVISILNPGGPDAEIEMAPTAPSEELLREGYVDRSGLLAHLSPELSQGVLQPFPDEPSAEAALRDGEISAYYVIPADYVVTGNLIYVNPDYRWPAQPGQSWLMQSVLFASLVGGDPGRLERARQPMQLETRPLDAQQDAAEADGPLSFFIPYGVTMIIYIVVLMAASLLMTSITDEKKNRTLEVLLSSVSPRELLTGKIVALGFLGLLQAVLWIGTGYALLRLSNRTLDVPIQFVLPPSVLAWAIVFCVLGYAVYASLMAAIGTLAPSARQASQVVFLAIWPMIVPLFFLPALIENTRGALATGLSLFPLTAPVAMMARLAVGNIPAWQPPAAALLVAATAVLVVRAAARLFRAQTLLSGSAFSIRRFVGALAGRIT